MWRRKDPEEYGIEVRDYEGEDGKFLVSLAGNAGIWFTWEGVGGFSFRKTNKFIVHLDGCRQVCLTDNCKK